MRIFVVMTCAIKKSVCALDLERLFCKGKLNLCSQ